MHFHLEDNILDINLEKNIDANSAIENLLNAEFAGFHVISASRAVLSQLTKSTSLSIRSRNVLQQKLNWYPMQAGAYEKIPFSAFIDANLDQIQRESNERWKIPLNIFSKFVPTPTLLVAESLTDCRAYALAAQSYILKEKLNSLTIKLKNEGGGGASTPDQLLEIENTKSEICLCITDSDRTHPQANPARTYRKCADIASNSKWLVKHAETTARELENIIPFCAYTESSNLQTRSAAKKLKLIAETTDPSILNYIDLKNGLSLHWLFSNSKESPTFKYWLNTIKHTKTNEQQKECLESQSCKKELNKDKICPECIIIPGVAKTMATHAITWLSNITEKNQMDKLLSSNSDEWFNIGRAVFSFCCASSQHRV